MGRRDQDLIFPQWLVDIAAPVCIRANARAGMPERRGWLAGIQAVNSNLPAGWMAENKALPRSRNTGYRANSQILAHDPAVDRFYSEGVFDSRNCGLLIIRGKSRDDFRGLISLRGQDIPGKNYYYRQAENHHP